MTCADFVCTALSSASRNVTARMLPRRACAWLCSSRAPTHACCVQSSLRSCPLAHPETPLSGSPLIVFSRRLTAAVRTKNSSPENLTHLHYNLLGKDSRGPRAYPGGNHAPERVLAPPASTLLPSLDRHAGFSTEGQPKRTCLSAREATRPNPPQAKRPPERSCAAGLKPSLTGRLGVGIPALDLLPCTYSQIRLA